MAIVFHGLANAINSWIPPFTFPVGGMTLSGFAVMESVWVIVALVIILLNWELFFQRYESNDALIVMH